MDAVLDSSVLIDLENCLLLEAFTKLPIRLHVTHILYEKELKPYSTISRFRSTFEVEKMPPVNMNLVDRVFTATKGLSKADLSSYLLARSNGWMLLTGDRKLRELAEQNNVVCHGVLWIFEQLLTLGIATPMVLHQSLHVLKIDPTCRLPLTELNELLERFELFFLHNSVRN